VKEKDAMPILESLGWKIGRDEVGDYFGIMIRGDTQVRIIPFIGKRADHFRVSFMTSVSSKTFSAAVSFIFGSAKSHESIIVRNSIPEKIADFSPNDVVKLSDDAISWGFSQDIEAGLTAYRLLQTDSKGAMPLRHLAALAIAGDVQTLSSYQRSFALGDRLGFVPYITADILDRALSVAQSPERNRFSDPSGQ
jgi:hypothetical protein